MYVRKNYSNTLKISVLFNLFLEKSLLTCGHKNHLKNHHQNNLVKKTSYQTLILN